MLPEDRITGIPGPQSRESENRIGLVAREITDEEKNQHNVEYGVVVDRVLEGPAKEAGIRPGDVVTLLDNEILHSLDDFDATVENIPLNKAVPARIVRRGSPTFLVIKITE